MIGGPIAQRAQVDLDRRGEDGGTDRTVRGGEPGADRGREAVHGAQPGVGQAQTAEQAGQRKVVAYATRPTMPFVAARRSDRAERRTPSRARASVNGLARRDSSGSMSWDSASMPLAAMVDPGRPTSRSGSTTATFGSSNGLRRLALTPSPARTALRVTSEPVPAVVGTATKGRPGRTIGRPAPIDLENAPTGRCPRWPGRRPPWRRRGGCPRRTRGRRRSPLRSAGRRRPVRRRPTARSRRRRPRWTRRPRQRRPDRIGPRGRTAGDDEDAAGAQRGECLQAPR